MQRRTAPSELARPSQIGLQLSFDGIKEKLNNYNKINKLLDIMCIMRTWLTHGADGVLGGVEAVKYTGRIE